MQVPAAGSSEHAAISDEDARAAIRAARSRAARPYVLRWRPAVFTFLFAATAGLGFAFPEDARTGVTLTMGLIWAVTVLAALGARLGVASPPAAAFVVTLLDIPLLTAWAMQTGSTGESLSALIGPPLVAAWLFGPRLAAVIGGSAVGASLVVWFVDGRWASPQVLPDVAWVLLGGVALAVALALEVERALLESTRSLRRSVAELRELARLRERLVADVSHELRTPLTSINGFLDTVLRDDLDFDDASRRELLLEARRGGGRLERLVSDLLDVERASGGSLALDLVPTVAADVVERSVRAVAVPDDRELELVIDGQLAAAEVLVDEQRIFQVIANLVTNAFAHGEGTVCVRARLHGGALHVDVMDEGAGIEPSVVAHVFEPFATFGSHAGSAGLGLAIARAFSVAHGGTLEYVADDGEGRHAFRIALPCTGAEPADV